MLKELTRGKQISIQDIRSFVSKLDINEKDKEVLINLTPSKYIGLAKELVFLNK